MWVIFLDNILKIKIKFKYNIFCVVLICVFVGGFIYYIRNMVSGVIFNLVVMNCHVWYYNRCGGLF